MNYKSEENLYFDENGNSKLNFLDSLEKQGVLKDYKIKTVKASPDGELSIDVSVVLWPPEDRIPNIHLDLLHENILND